MIKTGMEVVRSAYGHLCELGHGIRIAVGPRLVHSDAWFQAVHLAYVTDCAKIEARPWLIGYGAFQRRREDYHSAIFAWRADGFDNVSAEDAVARITALDDRFLEHALLVVKPDGRLGVPRIDEERRLFMSRAMSEDLRYTFGARLKSGFDPHLRVEESHGFGCGPLLPQEHEPHLAEALARSFVGILTWGRLYFPLPDADRLRRTIHDEDTLVTAGNSPN